MNSYSNKDNFVVLTSLLQCFALLFSSIYLLTTTLFNLPYFLGFMSFVMSILAIQILAAVYEDGPYAGNSKTSIAYVNDVASVSAFSLFFGVFSNVFLSCNSNFLIILYQILFVYISYRIYLFYNL